MAYIRWNYWYGHSDTLYGTAESDYIDAGGGNDTVYAGAGADEVYGGSGNDTLWAQAYGQGNAYWGNDFVYAGTGDDQIYYYYTLSDVVLFGDDTSISSADGNDYIYSGSGNDRLNGGGGNDTLNGGAGNDIIHGDLAQGGTGHDQLLGNLGSDSLYGDGGDDHLQGGRDGDWLSGGAGVDTFVIATGDSGLAWETADTILDFNRAWDWIDLPVAGTPSNFVSGTFITTGYTYHDVFAEAYHASFSMGSYLTKLVFLTDGQDGYLFADTDPSYGFDTGVQLLGLTSVNDLRYWDIV